MELGHYIDLCRDGEVQNATVQAGIWDLTTASGRMTARTLGNAAEFESEHRSERVRAAKEESAQKGAYQGAVPPLRIPGGKAEDGGGVEIIESEAAEIRRLADAVRGGQSLRSLALELNERGVPTVTGKRWSSAHLGKMLVRPRLAGLRSHQGKIVGKACWEPILTRETWEAVKEIVEDPARCTGGGGRRGPVPTTLGTGIYVCGVCGEPRLRLGRVGARLKRSSVYRCGNAMLNHESHVARVAEKLDAYVEGALLELISRPGVIEAMCNVIDTEDEVLAAMQREQATIRSKLNRAAKRYEADEIDDEQLVIISKRLRQRDSEITAALVAASKHHRWTCCSARSRWSTCGTRC